MKRRKAAPAEDRKKDMHVRILVLSDTHIPKTADDLPQAVYDEIAKADIILHAGDLTEKSLYEKLVSSKKRVNAVCGNMDSPALRATLPQKEVVEVGPFKIGLIHGYGAPAELLATVRKEFGKVDAIVFGHSHKATNTVTEGVLFFNPGSPTDKFFAPFHSVGILEVTCRGIAGQIIQLEEKKAP